MGCGCKTKKEDISFYKDENILPKKKLMGEIKNYTSKILIFLLVLLTIPIIICIIIYYMFTTIVLTKELNIKPFLFSLAKNMQKIKDDSDEKEYDYDDDDDEFLNEEDLIMLNVEDITKKDYK